MQYRRHLIGLHREKGKKKDEDVGNDPFRNE
jgi:hypothetical protein